jgi:hypothetical protein
VAWAVVALVVGLVLIGVAVYLGIHRARTRHHLRSVRRLGGDGAGGVEMSDVVLMGDNGGTASGVGTQEEQEELATGARLGAAALGTGGSATVVLHALDDDEHMDQPTMAA